MEFYALRVFDAARTRGVRPHFRCTLPLLSSPLWFTLTRYFDDTRSANTDKCTRVWEWRTGGGGKKKKITTEQTIRVTWTTATNNVGLVNELSRQKLQLLRVQEVWEPGKWIPCRPMTRDGRENNCWSIVESWVNYDIFFFRTCLKEIGWEKDDDPRFSNDINIFRNWGSITTRPLQRIRPISILEKRKKEKKNSIAFAHE